MEPTSSEEISEQSKEIKLKQLNFYSVIKAAEYLNTTTTSLSLHNNYIIKNKYLVKIKNEKTSVNAKSKKVRKQSTLVTTFLLDVINNISYPFRSLSAAAKFIDFKVANFAKNNGKILKKKWKVIVQKP